MRALFGLVVLLQTLGLVTAARAANDDATDPTCANVQLPKSIAVGSANVASPLPVIEVVAPLAELHLAVASDERSRELGLMCVLHLPPQSGMIFVFSGNARQEFWMKNTLVSLDMIWVRADGTVDTVAAGVPASTRTTPDDRVARRSGRGKFVVELAAGEAKKDGIARGSRLRLPPSF